MPGAIWGGRCQGWGRCAFGAPDGCWLGEKTQAKRIVFSLAASGKARAGGALPGAPPLPLGFGYRPPDIELGVGRRAENFLVFARPPPLSPVSSKSLKKVVIVVELRGSPGITPGHGLQAQWRVLSRRLRPPPPPGPGPASVTRVGRAHQHPPPCPSPRRCRRGGAVLPREDRSGWN